MKKLFLLTVLASATAWAAPEMYKIDPVHSQVGFKIRHFFSRTAGRFGTYSGTIQVDPKNPGTGWVKVEIDAASIDTANADRDKHLRSPDFFDTAKYPKMMLKARR